MLTTFATTHFRHEPPVDLSRLREMAGDDPQDLRTVVDLYLREADSVIRGLGEAVRQESHKEVRGLAHKLGGASLMCGMVGLVAPLRELERSGSAVRWAEKRRLVQEASRQKDLIHAYLSGLGTAVAC